MQHWRLDGVSRSVSKAPDLEEFLCVILCQRLKHFLCKQLNGLKSRPMNIYYFGLLWGSRIYLGVWCDLMFFHTFVLNLLLHISQALHQRLACASYIL